MCFSVGLCMNQVFRFYLLKSQIVCLYWDAGGDCRVLGDCSAFRPDTAGTLIGCMTNLLYCVLNTDMALPALDAVQEIMSQTSSSASS